jgi:GNAT superfamily N-acetyltransferase
MGVMPVSVRPLERDDHSPWLELFAAYNRFYRSELPAATVARTFERLCDSSDGFAGLLALDADGTPAGLAHLIFHPSTWAVGPYCYLEDLFVKRAARGVGMAQALFRAVYAAADERGAERVYWHTQEYNAPARSLYDQVGHRTSFVVYER